MTILDSSRMSRMRRMCSGSLPCKSPGLVMPDAFFRISCQTAYSARASSSRSCCVTPSDAVRTIKPQSGGQTPCAMSISASRSAGSFTFLETRTPLCPGTSTSHFPARLIFAVTRRPFVSVACLAWPCTITQSPQRSVSPSVIGRNALSGVPISTNAALSDGLIACTLP